jgi:hypothetical protein
VTKINVKKVIVFLLIYYLIGFAVLACQSLIQPCELPLNPDPLTDYYCPTRAEVLIGLLKLPFTSPLMFLIWEHIWPILVFDRGLLESFIHEI